MSRMMTTYTRRGLGQTYLKHTLLPQINLLVELGDNVTLEIDPLKVYAELARGDRSLPPVARVTPEEALENEAVSHFNPTEPSSSRTTPWLTRVPPVEAKD